MTDFGLTVAELRLIREVFRRHPEVTRVKVFGSRAKGTQRPCSDIDLVLWGDLDIRRVTRIGGELDELPLPYIFDVWAYDAIHHPEVKAHVDRVARVVYELEAEPVGET
jgi:predicted nucleotidyltransferase